MTELLIVIPGTPPSVNHYVKHAHGRHWITQAAKRFKQTVAVLAQGRKLDGGYNRYRVEAVVFLGRNQRGDVDNFGKLLLDSLVDAEVIYSDAPVDELEIKKARDWQNPRTEIVVKVLA